MKILSLYLVGLLSLGIIVFVGQQSFVYSDSNGPSSASTGGIGESTCLRSGCHTGNTLTNPTTLTLNTGTGTYTPGGLAQTFTLRNAGSAGARFGFQLKSVTGSNVQAGTLTAGTSERIRTISGKGYLSHSTPSTSGTWSFSWTPPTTDVGPITIYVASYNGNSRSASTISVKSFTLTPATVSVPNPVMSASVRLFPNPATDQAILSYHLSIVASVSVEVLDLTGKQISTYSLGNQTIGDQTFVLPLAGHINAGHYFVRIVSAGHVTTQRLVVL